MVILLRARRREDWGSLGAGMGKMVHGPECPVYSHCLLSPATRQGMALSYVSKREESKKQNSPQPKKSRGWGRKETEILDPAFLPRPRTRFVSSGGSNPAWATGRGQSFPWDNLWAAGWKIDSPSSLSVLFSGFSAYTRAEGADTCLGYLLVTEFTPLLGAPGCLRRQF